ncbi:MAG: hypothetical protein K8R68_02955 [Bacteroidales bacterium]|nr:hypothetical protein [Bacteroidales bacterium]
MFYVQCFSGRKETIFIGEKEYLIWIFEFMDRWLENVDDSEFDLIKIGSSYLG